MRLTRSSGILLHPTSLPKTAGIGTIGKQAYRFVDWLHSAKQTLWQILPIGPTGYGDSPYASFSTFAGNPLIIDLEMIKENGFLSNEEITPPEWMKNEGYIDFSGVVFWKIPVLKTAAKHFIEKIKNNSNQFAQKYNEFCQNQAYWLNEYAVFMSIKEFYDAKASEEKCFGAMWSNFWPEKLASHDTKTVNKWKNEHANEIEIYKVIQFFFFEQWNNLKNYANSKGISIIGDIPIFVAPDSADVWANQKLFQVDQSGKSTSVAGVPPDYFCATGQLWGNPLYNWEAMKKNKYAWWIMRIKAMLSVVDFVRIDHFRGFEAYWSVKAGAENAVNGEWVKGPDHDLFNEIKKQLGDIPIIAEDLGLITEEVKALRDDFELPGMRVLQFAFNTNEIASGACVNSFLPHMYSQNSVVYTGTHDNETMQGWLNAAKTEEIEMIKKYLGGVKENCELCPRMIQLAFSSVANFAIVPLQDIFAIGSEGRMNTPATTGGHNWQWRMSEEHFSEEKAQWLKELSILYARNIGEIES